MPKTTVTRRNRAVTAMTDLNCPTAPTDTALESFEYPWGYVWREDRGAGAPAPRYVWHMVLLDGPTCRADAVSAMYIARRNAPGQTDFWRVINLNCSTLRSA